MISPKPRYFNVYAFPIKLLALLIFGLFSVSCNKNDTNDVLTAENGRKTVETAVNINTASAAELEKLPNIGERLARRIVEHREKYGGFRRPEHLILVRGISDARFRELRDFIKTE